MISNQNSDKSNISILHQNILSAQKQSNELTLCNETKNILYFFAAVRYAHFLQ